MCQAVNGRKGIAATHPLSLLVAKMEDIGIATSALASTSLQDALPAPTRTADGREVIVTDNFEDMRTSWIDVLPQLSAAAEEMALGDLLEVLLEGVAGHQVAATIAVTLVAKRRLAGLAEDGPRCEVVVLADDVREVGVGFAADVRQADRLHRGHAGNEAAEADPGALRL